MRSLDLDLVFKKVVNNVCVFVSDHLYYTSMKVKHCYWCYHPSIANTGSILSSESLSIDVLI